MDRINAINQTDVERLRDALRQPEAGYDKPCPGSVLVQDDDIQWLEFVNGRIVWGHPNAAAFYCYAPDIFGDTAVVLDIGNVNDRAPVNPNESALPLYPEDDSEQQQEQSADKGDAAAQQHGGKPSKKKPKPKDQRQALQDVLKQLSPEQAKAAREKIQAIRPDLLAGH